MALRRQSLSPTANLLRNSRLFSLPNPLPRPVVGETSGAGVTKASDSATLPYPTHQAIATTKSSLARGDWGLKRNLPARSHLLQTSDPVLRITQLDTIEHVTDFDSAADHVRTQQKWVQLGAPMMRGMQKMARTDPTETLPPSAFEARDDTTSYTTADGLDESGLFLDALKQNKRARQAAGAPFSPFKPPPVDAAVHNTRRWKHDGPWLPGQSADEFVAYLSHEISKRRTEFNAYLREFVRNEIYTTRQLAASRSTDPIPVDPVEADAWQRQREATWRNITPGDINTAIRALRKETANDPLGSKLVQKLIVPFLRLPTIRFKYKTYAADANTRDYERYQFDSETAPLSTHPSAGLGYLRTKSYIPSHPILGPQAKTTPIAARVLQPRQTSTSRESYARLGVAGFVANDQYRGSDSSSSSKAAFQNVKDVETIDIDTVGGKKLAVNPQYAAVSNDGRVHIKVLRASGAETAVARGELEDRPPIAGGRPDTESIFGGKGTGNGNGKKFQGFARGKSGVPELDDLSGGDAVQELSEMSDKGRQLADFLKSPAPGKPGDGFPGVAEAVRPVEEK